MFFCISYDFFVVVVHCMFECYNVVILEADSTLLHSFAVFVHEGCSCLFSNFFRLYLQRLSFLSWLLTGLSSFSLCSLVFFQGVP